MHGAAARGYAEAGAREKGRLWIPVCCHGCRVWTLVPSCQSFKQPISLVRTARAAGLLCHFSRDSFQRSWLTPKSHCEQRIHFSPRTPSTAEAGGHPWGSPSLTSRSQRGQPLQQLRAASSQVQYPQRQRCHNHLSGQTVLQ